MKNKCLVLLLFVAFMFFPLSLMKEVKAESSTDDYDYLYMDTADITTVSLAEVFKDNMLIQCNKPVPVWGAAPVSSDIKVELLDKNNEVVDSKNTQSNSEGYFYVELDSVSPSFDEYKISINNGLIKVINVLFGELFLSCGQSNMGINVQYCTNADEILSNANNPYIRVFMSPEIPSSTMMPWEPEYYYQGGSWSRGDVPDSIKESSAVSYNFILKMFEKYNKNGDEHIPVGFLNTSKGSTSIEAWISRKGILSEGKNSTVVEYLTSRNRIPEENTWNTKGSQNFNQTSALFNAKIAPLTNLYISGIIWYQAENNVGNEIAGSYYREALKLIYKDWIKWFNDGKTNVPFIYVQPTPGNYKYPPESLAYMWEGMMNAYLDMPENFAMVTTYDIPLDWYNEDFAYRSPIHTLCKKPVGERMAYFMWNMLYDEGGCKSSPVFKEFSVNNNEITISFYNAESGLKSIDGLNIQGFTVCGADRIFYQADSVINDNGTVTISSRYVENPIACAYGFSTMITKCNLSNNEGIPVSPFRSDTIESEYYHPKNWSDCNTLEYFVSSGSGREQSLAYDRPAYDVSQIVSLSLSDDADKGKAVKISYTLRGKEAFKFAPILNYDGFTEDFHLYDDFSFKIKNTQTRNVTIQKVLVTLSDGTIGSMICRNNNETSVIINKNTNSYQYFSFDLTKLVVNDEIIDISSKRSLITNIEIYFQDYLSGSILIDSFELGNYNSLYNKEENPNEPVDPTPPTTTTEPPKTTTRDTINPTTTDNITPTKKGCRGSISAFSYMFIVLGLTLVVFKRKKN